MTDQYLTTVLEEPERVAEHHDEVVRSSKNPYHEYLRYAVLRLLEGEADEMSMNVPQIDGVTVGYGEDEAMYESWGDDVKWWETVPPQKECTRFRVFYPDKYEIVPRVSADVMAALGAWRVWTGNAASCGSYDHRERREVHYLWPEGHPVEALLENRLQNPTAAVAPDGGRTGDVRDRMVVTEHSTERDALEPRTRRAVDQAMAVSLLEKGGRYEVRSASGNWYEVDVVSESCTCPDWRKHTPEGGFDIHLRVNREESHATRTLGWDFQVCRYASARIYWLCQAAVSPIVALFQRRFRSSVDPSIAIDGSGRGSSVLVLGEAISRTYRGISIDTRRRMASKLSVLIRMTEIHPEPEGSDILAYSLCKHLRRVDYEIKQGRVPRPDGRLPSKS